MNSTSFDTNESSINHKYWSKPVRGPPEAWFKGAAVAANAITEAQQTLKESLDQPTNKSPKLKGTMHWKQTHYKILSNKNHQLKLP